MKKIIWKGSVVVVTGGGSGIGRAIGMELSKRGSTVVITDINSRNAAKVAEECGEQAVSFKLDVRDADAVKKLTDEIYNHYGSIDFLFNNAGIGVSGEAYEINAQIWDRIIDINIKGVLNGVLAVYPLMVKQGTGCIINTASLAGLEPAPLMTPYSMTKHAVVGFSRSLRIEAEKFGIQVNVLCPAAVETPILQSSNPDDLPEVPWVPETIRFLTNMAGAPYPVDKFVKFALRAIERNKGVIVLPHRARLASIMGRLFPSLAEKLIHKAVRTERSSRA